VPHLFLKDWRKARKLTQPALADRAGVHRVTISRLETGREAPTMETVAKLAGALGVEVGELFAAPKGTAPPSWRDQLGALSNDEQRSLALASMPGDEWIGGLDLGDLEALKAFCIEHGVTPDEVHAELLAQSPGLSETLRRQEAKVRADRERVRREIDAALGRAQDAS
jgi:transcriptional regulator with XRE-family HTH domain